MTLYYARIRMVAFSQEQYQKIHYIH